MYRASAALYDAIYSSFKDYAAEASRLAERLRAERPDGRSVLDVACGTAEHARLLHEMHGFEIDGIDLDPAFVDIARGKLPEGRFEVADMAEFQLGRAYDAVVCLFGSIGYAGTVPRLRQTLASLRAHVAGGGIVVVEPFLTPDEFTAGRTGSVTVVVDGRRVTRTNRSERDGRLCRLCFDYLIEGPDGDERRAEVHELGLFTVDETLEAFAAAGLTARHGPGGWRSGIYVASPA